TQRTEAGDAVTAAVVDGAGVASRAGDRAGGQVNAELGFGEAVGVAHRGNLGAHVMTSRRLPIQCGPVRVGRITVHLKVFRLCAALRAAAVVGAGASGRLASRRSGGATYVGAGLVQQLVDDLAIGRVGRGHRHVGDQLLV